MWELSAPGAEAEDCFLRLLQTDYYLDGRDTHLNWMPDVRVYSPDFIYPLTLLVSGKPSQRTP